MSELKQGCQKSHTLYVYISVKLPHIHIFTNQECKSLELNITENGLRHASGPVQLKTSIRYNHDPKPDPYLPPKQRADVGIQK